MNSIFSRLVSYSGQKKNSHLEDFTTELLVGMLEKDDSTLLNFIKYLKGGQSNWINYDDELRLFVENISIDDIDKWKISTQFILPSGKRPDICISIGNEPIVFIEHKIDSMPYKEQLKNYANFNKEKNKVCLILLSKYYDVTKEIKSDLNVPFRTIWWRDLCSMFFNSLQHSDNLCLLREFLKFLMEEEMQQKLEFDSKDIEAMNHVSQNFLTMDTIMNSVNNSKEFSGLIIDKKGITNYAGRSTHLQYNGIYVSEASFYKNWQIRLRFGFCMGGGKNYFSGLHLDDKNFPCSFISICIDKKNELRDNFILNCKDIFQSSKTKWLINPIENLEDVLILMKPLNELHQNNHINELTEWFNAGMKELIVIKDKYKDIIPNDQKAIPKE